MLASFFEGWLPAGIGESQPYPTFYFLGFVLWPFHAILTPLATAICIVTASIVVAACSARRIGVNRGSGAMGTVLAIFAILNPWVYSELVAGHIVMAFSYALLLGIVAEMTRPQPRTWALCVLSALLITQIEFWIVAIVPFIAWCIVTRRYVPIAIACLSALPIAVGIASSYHSLLATSYNLEWQQAQSLAPAMAFTLLGYTFHYASAFEPWRWVIALFALLGFTGIARAWLSGIDRIIVVIAVVCLLLAMGTRGPLAFGYSYVVAHVVESGVFRELFDLLAFVILGYVILAAHAMRNRVIAVACAVLTILLVVPWLQRPPYYWFVPSGALPVAHVPTAALYRIAYLPAFQPLTYRGNGSGVDPDAFPRPGKMLPLNIATPGYPIDAAMATASSGEFGLLSALSVEQIVARDYFSSDWRVLQYQLAFRQKPRATCVRTHALPALPMAVLYPGVPHAVSIGGTPTEDSVTPIMDSAYRFTPDRTTIDPKRGWIDARTAFVERPAWGNPWGGVATSGHITLAVPAATVSVLAQTSAQLLTGDNNLVATHSPSLRWWNLPAGTNALKCTGECIVVAALPYAPHGPEHAAAPTYTRVQMHAVTAWLATVEVPAGREATLRYNVRYDPHWVAYANAASLEHLALDGIVNAWVLPPSSTPRRLVLIESLAAAQLVLEIVAALALLLCLIFYATHSISEPGSPPR